VKLNAPYSVGVASSAVGLALWLIFLFWNPYRQPDTQGAVVPIIMVVIVSLGLGAALLGSAIGMLTFGVAALMPVGLYVLFSPDIFVFIGVSNIVFVGAAIWAIVVERLTARGLMR
jgi:hypothetical protein